MAITAYVGLPGHGKSYGVVANVIIPALRQKRLVYTNIPMHDEHCMNELGMAPVPFSIDDLLKNPNWFTTVFSAGAVLVLDECWRLWPSGVKASNVRDGDKAFLAEHRHTVGENGFSTEIYLVTQDLSQLAMFVRALIESTIRMVKLTNLGLDKRFRVDMYSGAVTGSKPPVSKREREIHGGKFKKEIYDFYKSHTKSETGFAGDETKTDKRFNILKGLSIKIGLIFVVSICVFIYFGMKDVKKGFGQDDSINSGLSSGSGSGRAIESSSGKKVQTHNNGDNNAKPVNRSTLVPVFFFLRDAKRLVFSHTIRVEDKIKDYFLIQFSDYTVTMDEQELNRLGYKLEKISECVVKVSGSDYSGFFMCAKRKEQSTGFASELVETAGTATFEVM